MKTCARNGVEEMHRANTILEKELPPELKAQVLPLKSPGWAKLVNFLYGFHNVTGVNLDPTPYKQYWVRNLNGSSSIAVKNAVIVADEECALFHLMDLIPKFFKGENERPGSGEFPAGPCVTLQRSRNRAFYFDQLVTLSGQQYCLLQVLAEWGQRTRECVSVPYIYKRLDPEKPNVTQVLSRIRGAFWKAAQTLAEEPRFEAQRLVQELFPENDLTCGYRIGRPELFFIMD